MSKSVYADNHLDIKKQNDAWTNLYNFVPTKSHVLDVGCSSGNFGRELIDKKQCTVVGIDICKDDIVLAREYLTEVYERNVEKDELSDLGQFDVIIMADVIEHLIDPVGALKKIASQLKPNGRLVFSVPNMANIAVRLELLAGRFEYRKYGLLDETHLHYYDRVQLEMVLSNSGLSVITYSNTLRDIPTDMLEGYLHNMGLKASDRFRELATNLDATTFQFVGVAIKSKKPHTAIHTEVVRDFVSGEFDKLIKDANENKKRYLELESSRDRAVEQLQSILNSRGWKILNAMHMLKNKFMKKK